MPVQPTETTRPWTFDARAGVVNGLTTAAWYTVPDLVERRSTRALLKTVCGVAGCVVLLRTVDGRQAIDGVRKVRDAVRDAGREPDPAGVGPYDGFAADVDRAHVGPGASDGTAPDLTPVGITTTGKVAIAVGAAVVVGATAALGVVGEKAAYRWGERMRARGVRAPHLRVGLVLGAASALLGGLNPPPLEDD